MFWLFCILFLSLFFFFFSKLRKQYLFGLEE